MNEHRGGGAGSGAGWLGTSVHLGVVVALTMLASTSARSATTLSYELCRNNRAVVPVQGQHVNEYKVTDPDDLTTFDARNASFLAYPFNSLYPFSLGRETVPVGLCSIGGFVQGQQSRNLTWDQMKTLHDGDGLRISGTTYYIVDGLRVDNVEDGVAPRGTEDRYPKDGDGLFLRNVYMTYIRDDCVENDDIAGGVIYDSLFDGCYTGVSERPGDDSPQNSHPAPAGEMLRLHSVLMRLAAMPGPRGTNNSSVTGHGQLFKWSPVANELVITDSIFLVEKTPNSDSTFPFPPGTITSNVKIVWLGPGNFTWPVPVGTTVTTARSVWDTARAEWLTRHGCSQTTITVCDQRLYNPDPDLTLL